MTARIMAGMRSFLQWRWPYCVAAWVCAGWLYADYAFRSGVRVPVGWPVIALVVLLAVLPCAPAVFSVAIIACCVVCTVVPFNSADVNWLSAVPMWLALAVLGYRLGSLKSLVAMLAAGALPSCFATVTGNELAASIAPSVQICTIWWCIGSMVTVLGRAERDKAAAKERSEQYEHRLRILHILHDSLANDLVYALFQCRAITSHGFGGSSNVSDTNEIRANISDISEIERTLERCLTRLRQDVIAPEREVLGKTEFGKSRGGPELSSATEVSAPAVPKVSLSAALAPVLAETTQLLNAQGWRGVASLNGKCLDADGETVQLVEACIRELRSNILKYGAPETYALEVETSGDHITVYSSNPVGSTDEASPELTSNCGLMLLRRKVEQIGGSMEYAQEDGEWTICVTIPCSGRVWKAKSGSGKP